MPTSCGGLLSSITLCVGPDMAFTPLDNDDPSKAIQLATHPAHKHDQRLHIWSVILPLMDKGFGRWSVLTNDVENAMSGSFTSGSGIEYSPLAWMEWKDGAWSEQWPYNGCTSVVAYEDVGTVHNKFICARSYGLASNPLHFIALSISSPISFRLFACRINWLAVWHDMTNLFIRTWHAWYNLHRQAALSWSLRLQQFHMPLLGKVEYQLTRRTT